MAFDPSGVFSRIRNWQQDAANGVRIRADYHDESDDEIATALSLCLCRDGRSTVSANIPFSGHKITNLGDPVDPADAANFKAVNALRNFATSITIQGADANGRITFSGTGVNGLQWTIPAVAWLAKKAEAAKTSDRLVMINAGTGNVSDVFTVDRSGNVNNNGVLTHNLSHEGASTRTIAVGIGTKMTYTGGAFALSSNDTASTVAYQAMTMREYFKAQNGAGSCFMTLTKSGSGKYSRIYGNVGSEPRWAMDLGNATAESATRKGSDFGLFSYDNSGANAFAELSINRETHTATFGGTVVSASNFDSVSTTCILSATTGGTIYFRPNGPTSTVEQSYIDTDGDLRCARDTYAGISGPTTYGTYAGAGIREKAGSGGTYGDQFINFWWNGSTLTIYANTTPLGQVAWQSDYRTKRDIQPLPSMWDKVKALKPISYRQKAYQIYVDDDTERWGFLAHELQEELTDYASTGVKDGSEVQQPNFWVVMAAAIKALQESMGRIEALEAKIQALEAVR